MQEQNAWNLLNADRAANGLPALPLDAELSAIARKKSEDMRDQGYFSHTSPTYGKPADMLTSFGYAFTSVGENIAHHATVEKAQAAGLDAIIKIEAEAGHGGTSGRYAQWKQICSENAWVLAAMGIEE